MDLKEILELLKDGDILKWLKDGEKNIEKIKELLNAKQKENENKECKKDNCGKESDDIDLEKNKKTKPIYSFNFDKRPEWVLPSIFTKEITHIKIINDEFKTEQILPIKDIILYETEDYSYVTYPSSFDSDFLITKETATKIKKYLKLQTIDLTK